MTTDTVCFCSSSFSRIVLLSVSQYHTDDHVAPVQQKNKKYDLKFKLSVVKYAEENSGEAAARCFSVDPKRVRDWRKNKTELQRLFEEDRKEASEKLEIIMREMVISKHAHHERVSCKITIFSEFC